MAKNNSHIHLLRFIPFLLLIIISCSCKKQNHLKNELMGTWELRSIRAMAPTTYTPGKGNTIVFLKSNYQKFENHMLVKTGTYRVVQDQSVSHTVGLHFAEGEYEHRIIFDNDLDAEKSYINIKDGKMGILSGYFPLDGGIEYNYEKIE